MTDAGHDKPLVRLVGELIIVFVGVLLALAADDFREARSERSEALQSLELLVTDLMADSSEFASVGEDARRVASSIAWFAENWHRESIPADSLEVALYTFSTRRTLQLNSSAYAGLESSNGLRLLEPDSLRQGVLRYYQSRQATIGQWDEDVDQLSYSLIFGALPQHIIDPPGATPGDMWPPAERRVGIRTSWQDIQADAQLYHLLIQLGRVAEFYGDLLAGGETATGELLSVIRLEL